MIGKIEQPLSPHLQIYRLPFTALLSIVHRITGLLLYFGFIFFAWTIIFSKFFPTCMTKFSPIFFTKPSYFIFFLWTFCLFYHAYNGIRHLIWDIGFGFEIKNANLSGLVVLVLSTLTNFMVWNFIFS